MTQQRTERLPLTPLTPELRLVLKGERYPQDLSETRAVLLELARRKAGRFPPEVLVEQALAVSEGTDWPSRRAALEALLRRLASAARDELAVTGSPKGRVLGPYALAGGPAQPANGKGKKRRTPRPYHTELLSLSPVRGSCDCADYLRGSLGLCKHLLVVLEAVLTSAAQVEQGTRENAEAALGPASMPVLRWDPVRPWNGAGDRLQGLSLTGTVGGEAMGSRGNGSRRSGSRGGPWSWFREGRLEVSKVAHPGHRAALLRSLVDARGEGTLGAESGALALVRAELERAERHEAAKKATPALLRHLRSLERELYPYQREGIERFLERRRLLLADDMGLGKTIQAIGACHALFCSGTIGRGLIIAPAALKAQWVREWQATTSKVPVVAVDGPKDERSRILRSTKRGFLVMNYEQLLRDLREVLRYGPEMVVLDEAQRIKNWATKSYSHVMALSPEWRLVLTGTPFENRLEELATLLDWVDDVALTPKWRLVPWHSIWANGGRRARTGARNLETLRERLAPCMTRRVRREVLAQLPPRTDVRVPVEMTEPQREEHDALAAPIARLVQIGHGRPLRQQEFLKLMQLLTQQRIISNGLAQLRYDDVWPTYSRARADEPLLRSACSPKLLELRSLVQDLVLEQDRKVVIFSQWRKMLRLCEWAVRDLLEDRGLRAVFFTGAESQGHRTRNVVDFHDDPTVRVMFLSDAGGVGLNLQRAASACINLELPWNPAVLEQRIGRIYRLGQPEPVDIFTLVSEYGIECRIAGLVNDKQALFAGLFDGTSDEIRYESPQSFLSEVERVIEPLTIPEPILGEGGDSLSALESEEDDLEPMPVTQVSPDTLRPNGHRLEEGPTPRPAGLGLEPGAESGPAPAARGGGHVAALFERVSVTRTPSGGLRVEAEPEAAEELAALLAGLAGMLRAGG